ncbi:hypothetical protein [Streptomyces sp. T028]|uniref:hypothetical protein n=1 Tax=Streptomyces sp. T028 TaxID=3394379 RepID=UPI003A875299
MAAPTSMKGFLVRERFQQCEVEVEGARSARHPDEHVKEVLLRLRAELREVMDRSEGNDPELFERAHRLLDEVGGIIRRSYRESCVLEYREGAYYRECPVDLAHRREGLSPEMRVRGSECSVCGADPDDCDHIPGNEYDGQVCNSRITDCVIEAVALVGRPRWQVTRITSLGVDVEDLRQALGPEFTPGIKISCDHCISGCQGLISDFGTASHS